MRRISELAAAATVGLMALHPDALAQSTDSAASETLFRDGKRLLDQRDYAHACPKLAESFRLEPATGTLLALARCHEGEGKIASAWAEYADAAARARREGRPDREQAAQQWASALEPKLSTVTIAVSDAASKLAGLEVKRDGSIVGVAAWGVAVPVDPGEHLVEATATGKKGWSKSFAIRAPSTRKRFDVSLLEDSPAEGAAEVDASTSGLSSLQQTGLVVGGAGVVAVGVGAFFGVQAIRKNNMSDGGCIGDECDPAAKELRLEARASGNVSTAAFIGGGALLVGGVIMYWAGAEGGPKRSGVRFTPSAGRSDVGILVSGSF